MAAAADWSPSVSLANLRSSGRQGQRDTCAPVKSAVARSLAG